MSKIRRWLGRSVVLSALCMLAACGSFQPSQTSGTKPASSAVVSTAPSNPDPLQQFIENLSDTPQQTIPAPTIVSQDQPLVHALAERFHKPETLIQRVVGAANRFAHGDFPLRNDILAIIAVESSFNPRASCKGSKGLMQIQLASHRKDLAGRDPYDVETNVEVGSGILHDYFVALHGNERAAVLAYNSGIGSYERRHYKTTYYRKFVAELSFIRSISA